MILAKLIKTFFVGFHYIGNIFFDKVEIEGFRQYIFLIYTYATQRLKSRWSPTTKTAITDYNDYNMIYMKCLV